MRKLIFLGFILAIVGLASCTNKTSNAESGLYPELDRETIMENLTKSFDAATRSAGSIETVYPDYYGGGYTDPQGQYVIMIKGDIKKVKKDIEQRTLSSGLNLKSCEYSFNELRDLNNKLLEFYEDENIRKELGWTNGSVSVRKNRVIVNLAPLNDEAIQKFKSRVSDHPAIIFELGGEPVADVSANLGGKVAYLDYSFTSLDLLHS